MEEQEIILDRLCLLSDFVQNAPEAHGELFAALSAAEQGTLRALLEKLTDRAEELFTAHQQKHGIQPAPAGERSLVCPNCALLCAMSWDEEGTVSGARCQMGYQTVADYLASLEEE